MTALLTPTLSKKEFTNWLKGALAVLFARDGLIDLVGHEITDIQRDLLQTLYTQTGISFGTTCSSCTTANVLACPTAGFCSKGKKCKAHDSKLPEKKPNKVCPNRLCSHIRDAIKNEHRFKRPSWKNTDARKWCSDAFELSKCFLPSYGYSDKTCLADIDFNGILALVINNTQFQSKFSVNLGLRHNICTKARTIGHQIRYSANHLLSDQDLIAYIDDLITLLSDPAYFAADVKANDAVSKLKQLKTNTLTIHADDITNILNESITTTLDDQQKALLHRIQEHFKKNRNDSVEAIDRIQNWVDSYYTELTNLKIRAQSEQGKKLGTKSAKKNIALDPHNKTIEKKLNVEDVSSAIYLLPRNNLKRKILDEGHEQPILKKKTYLENFNTIKNNDKGMTDLKNDLMTYYRENESMIPAAPLIDKHKVPIEDLYVLPPMWAYKKPFNFGLGTNKKKVMQTTDNDAQEKQETQVSQIFLSDNNVRYKKIYITANAGVGKTSLSQKLTMTWCQAQSPLSSLTEKYKGEELNAMKYFDLLFLLYLRDYQSEQQCNLDGMIMQMLSNNLSRSILYTEEFLHSLLHKKRCLILIDGLDGWVHPDKCRQKPAVPHNQHPDSCTVLITCRPWKLRTIGLSEHNIDRHIEISELDLRTRHQLEEKAIQILNDRKLNLAGKNIADFDEAVESVEIRDIIYNPYSLLQLICLFFGGLPIGKSKCEIYSHITEFTLERGLNEMCFPDMHVLTNDNAPVPNCMTENETCQRYFVLIMKLGKLAFYTLFSEKREASLIFDRRIVTQYMTEQEIEFCLTVGLLCQTKDSSIIAVKRYQVFFQHRSVQEYFSAIYITSEFQNESVKATILNICSSLLSTLEMENVFVFICGMNPEMYTHLSADLQKIGGLDTIARRCGFDLNSDDDSNTIISYQSMQIQCLQESIRNGNESFPIDLYVVFDRYLSIDLTTLKSIIQFNKGHVKSLVQLTEPTENITAFLQSLDPGTFTSLETLIVENWIMEPVWLAEILTKSACTLNCLKISPGNYAGSSLFDISLTALTGLTCLQSLCLAHVHMTHSNLKCLYAYISQTTTLTHLKLVGIHCSDHGVQFRYCDVILNLPHLKELELHFLVVPCIDLRSLQNEGRTVQVQHKKTMERFEAYEPDKSASRIHASDQLWIKCLVLNNTSYGFEAIRNKQLPSQQTLDDIVAQFGKKSQMVNEICNLICRDIESKSELIVDVWPATKNDESKITFVVIVNDTDNKDKEVRFKQAKLTNYTFVTRTLNKVSDEGKEVMYSQEFDENLSQTSAEEFERIRKCINAINTEMMKKHKYLTMISWSPLRSKGYGTKSHILERQPCIVLSVLVKGYIPIQEDSFDRSYCDIPVDVREGFVTLFTESADSYHTSLKHGCQISKNGCGTLGGFIDLPGFGICGLTCAHVVLNAEEMKTLLEKNGEMTWHFPTSDQYVYQPNNNITEQSCEQRDHKAGKLVKAIYKEGDKDNSGMDIALFQVESRYPVTGCFPSLRDGRPSNMSFDTGETAGYSRLGFGKVTKFGASTDVTDGTVLMEAPNLSIRSTYYNVEVFKDFKITLHNLLEVKSASVSATREVLPFAMPGDSGALVFSRNKDDKLLCIGVLEGGTSNGTCFVMPISPILEELKLPSLKNFEKDKKFNHIEEQLKSLRNDINHVNKMQTSTDDKVQQIIDNQPKVDQKLEMMLKIINERLPAQAAQENQNNNH